MSRKIRIPDVTDYQSGTFRQVANGKEYELNDPLPNAGKTFTPQACTALIFAKIPDYGANKDQTMACEFSKASLLQILQQKGCEGIRFTFCRALEDDGKISAKESLVAFGLNGSRDAIGAEHYAIGGAMPATTMPIALEKGNRLTVKEVEDFLGAPLQQIKLEDFSKGFFKAI